MYNGNDRCISHITKLRLCLIIRVYVNNIFIYVYIGIYIIFIITFREGVAV